MGSSQQIGKEALLPLPAALRGSGAPALRPRIPDPPHRISSASRSTSRPKLAGSCRGRLPPAAGRRSHGNSWAAWSSWSIESAAAEGPRHRGRARNYNPQNASRAACSRSGDSGPASWGVSYTGAIHSFNKYSLSLRRASGLPPRLWTHSSDQGDELPDLVTHKSTWGRASIRKQENDKKSFRE